MKTIRFFLVTALMTLATSAFAQFANMNSSTGGRHTLRNVNTDNYGRIEVSFASVKIEDFDDNFSGASIGYIWGKSLSSQMPIFVEFGMNVTWATFGDNFYDIYDDYDYDFDWTLLNTAVPLNLVYKFTLPDNENISISPFFGINFKYNIIAKAKLHGNGVEDEYDLFDDEEFEETANRFQFGMNVGIGFSYKNLYIGYRFQPDFVDFIKDTKSKTNFVSLGVNF